MSHRNVPQSPRIVLEGGPSDGLTIPQHDAMGEFLELECPPTMLGDPKQIAVYRRALHIPNRFTFQGMKPA